MREVGRSSCLRDRLVLAGVFLAAWGAVGLLAHLAVPTGQELSAIWPAAGVAVLGFLVRRATWRSIDTVLLAAAAVLVNFLTGATLDLALVPAATNTVQTLVAVALSGTTVEISGVLAVGPSSV